MNRYTCSVSYMYISYQKYPIFLKLPLYQTMLNSSNLCRPNLIKICKIIFRCLHRTSKSSSEDFQRRFLYIPTCISKSEPVLHKGTLCKGMQQRFKISLSTIILMEGESLSIGSFRGEHTRF